MNAGAPLPRRQAGTQHRFECVVVSLGRGAQIGRRGHWIGIAVHRGERIGRVAHTGPGGVGQQIPQARLAAVLLTHGCGQFAGQRKELADAFVQAGRQGHQCVWRQGAEGLLSEVGYRTLQGRGVCLDGVVFEHACDGINGV